jgi:hypothetical protein
VCVALAYRLQVTAAVAWIQAERQAASGKLLAGVPARDIAGFLAVTDYFLRQIDAQRPRSQE